MSKLEFKIVNLLVLFYSHLLITGPFLADLALSVSSIIFIIFIIRTQQFSLLKDNYFLVFFSFMLLLLLVVFSLKLYEKFSLKISFILGLGYFYCL